MTAPLKPKFVYSAEDSAHETKLSALVFGATKSGKSTLVSTAPRPMFVIDADGSAAPIFRGAPGVSVATIRQKGTSGWADILEALTWLETAPGAARYETVVFDNLTHASKLCLDFVIGTGAGGKPRDELSQTHEGDWGVRNRHFLSMLRRLKEFSVVGRAHVIMTAWSRNVDGALCRQIQPDLSPGLYSQAAGLVDMVGYIDVDIDGNRTLTLKSGPHLAVGYRTAVGQPSPLKPKYRIKPEQATMTKLIEKLYGGTKS